MEDSRALHPEGGVHPREDVSPLDDILQMDLDTQGSMIISTRKTIQDPDPQNNDLGGFSDGMSPAISRISSSAHRIEHLGNSSSSSSEDRTEGAIIKDVRISRIAHGRSSAQLAHV